MHRQIIMLIKYEIAIYKLHAVVYKTHFNREIHFHVWYLISKENYFDEFLQ